MSNSSYIRWAVLSYVIILGRVKGFFHSCRTKVSSQKDKRIQTRECGHTNFQPTERIYILTDSSQALVPVTANLRLDSTGSLWWVSVGKLFILSVLLFHCREELSLWDLRKKKGKSTTLPTLYQLSKNMLSLAFCTSYTGDSEGKK